MRLIKGAYLAGAALDAITAVVVAVPEIAEGRYENTGGITPEARHAFGSGPPRH